ncbi:MAG: M20/M25/M40 family metallo-hydrolase [Comamonadaceae bacterium]|nr:M20/M25/M40 family metallo-hydrolase [Comamonadaceae bacterium]
MTPPGGRAGGPGCAGARQARPPAAAAAWAPWPRAAAFFKAEGVLGTFTTAPRGHGIYTVGGNRAADPATTLPAIAIGAEHYGRIARMLAKNIPVTIEADIRNTFHPNPPVFNIVGELPGTDKADEIVMLGGHFDTWHAATGAADNGVGVAAMMEAMRILKTSGVKLRRTVRIGLWGGEEQGLLGSREYVAAALRQPPARGRRRPERRPRSRPRPVPASGRPRRLRPPGPPRAEAGLRQVLGLLQHRQRHRRAPGHLPPGQRRRGADLPRVDGAVPQPRA